jgi:isoleucyl-tRNA synthetase
VQVILGEHVTTEAGTGAVHTAPGHGQDDFVVGKQYKLPVNNPVGPDGVFLPSTELFGGEFVFKANDHIVEVLDECGVLLHKADYEHSYPHCWRHRKPIIFRATAQWFIGMDRAGLRQQALDDIEKVSWLPDWGQARIRGMVENRPDWCVSRQRTWGVPITLYTHRETGDLHPDTASILEQVALRIEKQGINAWFDLDDSELLGDKADDYEKVPDILDVWFDSGTTHDSVLATRDELGRPADLYLEGSDQHRGWFQSSLLTAVAITGEAPYREVLTHGFTVDAEGHKMSKSRGNVIAPQKVFDSLGADILRLWVASSDYRSEMTISDEVLKRVADSYRRIRNTTRYLLGNLDDFTAAQALPYAQMLSLDQWALRLAASVDAEMKACYSRYQFHQIYQRLHQFCAVEMGGFYLDVLKDRLYTTRAGSRARLSAQTVMHHILESLVRWVTPILSFTGEEIWQHMSGQREESVLLATWYEGLPAADVEAGEGLDDEFWSDIIAVRSEVGKQLESLRADGKIGSSLDASATLYCDEVWLGKLRQIADELHFVFITSAAHIVPLSEAPGDASDTGIEGVRLTVSALEAEKCVRCWHRREDVGQHAEHPELCGRCIENVDGPGEERRYA